MVTSVGQDSFRSVGAFEKANQPARSSRVDIPGFGVDHIAELPEQGVCITGEWNRRDALGWGGLLQRQQFPVCFRRRTEDESLPTVTHPIHVRRRAAQAGLAFDA